MFSVPTTAAAVPSLLPPGAQQLGSTDGLEQLFAQLMQQIQAAMEQAQLSQDGAMLPSELPADGEALPQELLAQLFEFADQLEIEPSAEQRQQLVELVEQLTEEGVAAEQLLQLGQAALVAQDAQLQRQEQPDHLLQLVEAIRATPTEQQDSERQPQHAIDQLLALAERLRGRDTDQQQGSPETRLADQSQAGRPVDGIEQEQMTEQEPVAVSEQKSAAVVPQATERPDVDKRPVDTASPQRGEPERVVPAAERAVERTAERAAVELKATAAIPRPADAAQAANPAPVRGGNEAEAVAPRAVVSQRTEAPLEPAANPAESNAKGEQRQDNQRDPGLARWVELRNSVFAQGQKLASNEAFFNAAATQSATEAEPFSLIQASRNAASLVQLQQAYQSTSTAPATGQALALGERFGSDRWTPAASQRIIWMAGQQFSTAEIRLDPPELGTLNIKLHIAGEQASLSFTSPHAQVREVLEQQMPRLKEMLAEGGLELGQSDVSDHPRSEQSEEQTAQAGAGIAGEAEDEQLSLIEQSNQRSAVALSLVDYYA